MEPAFLKDNHPNREALRIRHGKQSRKVPSIHLRHLPGPQVLPRLCLPTLLKTPSPSSPPARPDPAGESLPLPTLPPPSRPSPRRSSGPSPWRLQTRGSQDSSWLRAEALPGAASRGSHPAGSGDSPPPETAEKLGQECQTRLRGATGHSPPPRRPPAGCLRNSALETATCPAPSQTWSAGREEVQRSIPPQEALRRGLTCRPLLLQRPQTQLLPGA